MSVVVLYCDHSVIGLWIILCYLCLVFVMLSRLFIAALWSPAGKGLISWLLFVTFNCVFCHFPMWYPGSGVVLDCIVS